MPTICPGLLSPIREVHLSAVPSPPLSFAVVVSMSRGRLETRNMEGLSWPISLLEVMLEIVSTTAAHLEENLKRFALYTILVNLCRLSS